MEFLSYLRVTTVLLTRAVSLETLLTVMDLNILLHLQDILKVWDLSKNMYKYVRIYWKSQRRVTLIHI